LYDALTTGMMAGAAIDVFEKEPYDGQLAQLKNVILSPHNSSMTLAARDKMEMGAVTDCLRVLENKHPINEVTYEL
jgi:D-3-phosphoglycerate dehydrogenase